VGRWFAVKQTRKFKMSNPINVQRLLRTLSIHPGLRLLVLASAFVALTAQYARAQERTLTGMNGAPNVIVWKNHHSLQQGTELVSAGVGKKNPALIVGLIACIVPSGTSAIVAGSDNVLVTSGEFSGCRGAVDIEAIGK
jgi:hypothetical protein